MLPDEVDTDMLAPTQYLALPLEQYSRHCMEGLIPEFAENARPGDIIIAGSDFGKGSSREHAALSLKHLGITAVIAMSVSPIMKRNLINLGISVHEVKDIPRSITTGDEVELTVDELKDLTNRTKMKLQSLPAFVMSMMEHGGLFEMVLEKGGISSFSSPLNGTHDIKEVGSTRIYPAYEKYIDVVAERLEKGEVLLGPFDTTYGLFASIKRPDAVRKIYDLKKRKDNMPLTLIVPRERFKEFAEVPKRIELLLQTELKGPISIILPKRGDRVPDYITSKLKTVSLADGENSFMKRIMERMDICGTSANISGQPPPPTLTGALAQLGDGVTLVVDGGPSLYRIGHTVIDLSVEPPKLIRAGPYSTKKLQEIFPELLIETEEGLPDELIKGMSVVDLSPEVEINVRTREG